MTPPSLFPRSSPGFSAPPSRLAKKRPGLTLSSMGVPPSDDGSSGRGGAGAGLGSLGLGLRDDNAGGSEQGGTPFSNFRKIV